MKAKDNKPIIIKENYAIHSSEMGFCIPVTDKDGVIDHYLECTEEQYEAWVESKQLD